MNQNTEEDEVIGEFEVSFNYKNVLYVCQVQPAGGEDHPYYEVEYFSPNGKGIISKLVWEPSADGSNTRSWKAVGQESDPQFLQELGSGIEKNQP
jgi:hypothetical protein